MRRFWRSRKHAEFECEIAFHLDELTAHYTSHGMQPAEARRRALVDFGGKEQAMQQLREVHTRRAAEWVLFHVRSAFRSMRKSPSLAFAVIATLALGVGANSAVFSVVDSVLLKPLPFPHADRLVRIEQHDAKAKTPESFVSTQRVEDLNRLSTTFQAITGWYGADATLTGGEMPEKVAAAYVAPRFLKTWGITPALGRGFVEADYTFHAPTTVLVTDRFWRSHLQADPKVVGRALRVGQGVWTVVGVLPRNFFFPDPEIDLFSPNPVDAPYAMDRSSTWFNVIGRLKPGVTLDQARSDLGHVAAELAKSYPATDASLTDTLQPLKSVVTGSAGEPIWLVFGAVTVLLVIACTNIAALLMARTVERQHEIAIRFALGASRRAVAMQVLSETSVLVFFGAILGLLLASGTSRLLALAAKDLPRLSEVSLDWRLVGYTGACALLVTLLCGLGPAFIAIGGGRAKDTQGRTGSEPTASLLGALASGGYTNVSARGRSQWIFVGLQVTLAVAMLLAAGFLVRSFTALQRVDPGYKTDHVLTLRVSGNWAETADMSKLGQRVDRTLAGLRALPGVREAATAASLPGDSSAYPAELKVVEAVAANAPDRLTADLRYVSTGYFNTMQIPLLLGQSCRDGLPYATALVNQSFADKYLGGARALGMHLKPPATFIQPAEIVGVVGNAREQGANILPVPTVYWCFSAPSPDPNYLVRVDGSPMKMADAVRRRVHELEPTRSVFAVMPLDEHLADRAAENRLLTELLVFFAAAAVLLVGLGLFATVNYVGRQRRREIGLRLAVGALPRQIVARFVGHGLRVTAVGAVLGLLLGAIGSRLLASQLYGVAPSDWPTYVTVLGLTLFVACLATTLPAVRAARVNPTEIMREQ